MSQQPSGPAYPPPGQPWTPPQAPPGYPQAPQGQPGQPPQPYPGGPAAGPPMGGIALTIQGSVMTSNMIVPSVRVNGYPIQTRYGRQDIPVPAGPVRVEASAQWMRTYGQAAMVFTVQPGQLVPVFYAAPMHQFTTGMIGHEPQKRKGIGVFIAMLALIPLIVVLMILIPLILA